jgi:hypothetical protein
VECTSWENSSRSRSRFHSCQSERCSRLKARTDEIGYWASQSFAGCHWLSFQILTHPGHDRGFFLVFMKQLLLTSLFEAWKEIFEQPSANDVCVFSAPLQFRLSTLSASKLMVCSKGLWWRRLVSANQSHENDQRVLTRSRWAVLPVQSFTAPICFPVTLSPL